MPARWPAATSSRKVGDFANGPLPAARSFAGELQQATALLHRASRPVIAALVGLAWLVVSVGYSLAADSSIQQDLATAVAGPPQQLMQIPQQQYLQQVSLQPSAPLGPPGNPLQSPVISAAFAPPTGGVVAPGVAPGQAASAGPPPGGLLMGNVPLVASAPQPPNYYASFGGQPAIGPNDPPVPQNYVPAPGDITARIQALEAEIGQLRQAAAPAEKRFHDLEEADKRLGARPLPLIRLSGFFQYDTGLFTQNDASRAALGDIQNGSGFRRTRLQGLGQLTEFTTFSIEMDFAFAGRPSFMDVWGEQSHLPFFGHVRIGQYRQPVTMDSWTNIKHLEFLERSAPFIALDPFRRVGIMAWENSEDERTMWAYSLFGTGFTFWNNGTGTVPSNNGTSVTAAPSTSYNTEGNDNRFGTVIGNMGGIAVSSRLTHLLYYDPHADNRYLMHIGGGYLFGQIGGNSNGITTPPNTPAGISASAPTYQARAIPEFFVGDQAGGFVTAAGTPNVVDTGRFLADYYQLLHTELAGNAGSFSYQSEFMAAFVQPRIGAPIVLPGAYAQCGYFLTGENAGYNKLQGALDYNVKPHSEFFGTGRKKRLCGWGAWQIAGRWSYLDLTQATRLNPLNYSEIGVNPNRLAVLPTNQNVLPVSPNPGVLNEPTVALNWWWNQYMRVQFNYIYAMQNSEWYGHQRTNLYTLRFQTEF